MKRQRPGDLAVWQVVVRLIRFSPWRFTFAVGSGIAVFGLPVATGLVIRLFFDFLSGATGLGLSSVIALFLAVDIAIFFGDSGLSFFYLTFLQTGMATLRHNLLHEILRREQAAALPESAGAALSRFRDDAEEIVDWVDAWIDIVGRTIFATAALWVLLRIDAGLTVSLLIPLVAVVTAVNLAGERLQRYRRAYRQATSDVTGFLGEVFGAAQAIQIAGATPHVVQRFGRLNDARRKTGLADQTFGQLVGGFFGSASSVAIGVLLLFAGQSMRAGTFTVGDFALFVAYLPDLSLFGDEIARWITGYRRADVSARRMAELVPGGRVEALVSSGPTFLSRPPSPADFAGQRAPRPEDLLEVLEVRGLTCGHADGAAIGPVDLTIRCGQLVVITGRIGAGKTTLLETLLGLLPAAAGQVLWNGVPVNPWAGELAPPRVAYVPQVPRLVSETLRDNILLGIACSDEALRRALHVAMLDPDVERLEHGLGTIVGPRGVRLSGGQVQRAAAARALVRAPQLLVLDDLSSALDVETERLLWERLRATGQTILAVTHRRPALERADHVFELEGGRLQPVQLGRVVVQDAPP